MFGLLCYADDFPGYRLTNDISDALWNALAAIFTIEQIFEVIALIGYYHTVSFFANGLRLAAEPNAAPPPDA